MQEAPSSQSITIKIITILLLIFLDLIISSFVQPSFGLSYQAQQVANFYFIPIQIVTNFLILIMILVLMWQTFPLRYGLIGTLLNEFKWSLIIMIGFLIITLIERSMRLSLATNNKLVVNYQAQIWSQSSYLVFYYLRFLSYPVFYGIIVSFCMRIIHPTFYKPNIWIK